MIHNLLNLIMQNLVYVSYTHGDLLVPENIRWSYILIPTGCLYRKSGSGPSICGKGHDVESPYYRPLQDCIGGMQSRRWIPIEQRRTWPTRADLNKKELAVYGNC